MGPPRPGVGDGKSGQVSCFPSVPGHSLHQAESEHVGHTSLRPLPSASTQLGQGTPASGRRRGSPTKVKAPEGARWTAKDAAKHEGKRPAAPRPRGWHRALEKGSWLGRGYTEPFLPATTSVSSHSPERPNTCQMWPPMGTEFIFLPSCDNTWLCLFITFCFGWRRDGPGKSVWLPWIKT